MEAILDQQQQQQQQFYSGKHEVSDTLLHSGLKTHREQKLRYIMSSLCPFFDTKTFGADQVDSNARVTKIRTSSSFVA